MQDNKDNNSEANDYGSTYNDPLNISLHQRNNTSQGNKREGSKFSFNKLPDKDSNNVSYLGSLKEIERIGTGNSIRAKLNSKNYNSLSSSMIQKGHKYRIPMIKRPIMLKENLNDREYLKDYYLNMS